MKKYLTIELEERDYSDFIRFCDINGYDEGKKVKQCFIKGYNIEKYGLLSDSEPKIIEKEVIKEVIVEKPVEIIKEIEKPVEIIKEIPVEKIVVNEVIKEVPIERVVEKEIYITDNEKVNGLLSKIQELESRPPQVIEKEVIKEVVKEIENTEKIKQLQESIIKQQQIIKENNNKILQLERKLLNCNDNSGNATFLRSSNLKY